VLIGAFNPAIIEPHWLARMELIGGSEADATKPQVISTEVSSFRLSWASFQVLKDRFAAESLDQGHDVHLYNLVDGIFKKLEHTPLRMLGLMRRSHYEMPSIEDWHALGDHFAPKAIWKDILASSGPRSLPGLRTLVVEGNRSTVAKWTRIKIEPSLRMPPGKFGVFIEVHEEYAATTAEDDYESSQHILRTLESEWSSFIREADSMSEKILSLGA
jgi:hypothetical protein